MEVTVKLKHLRIAPRKTRDVVDLIRGKTAVDARNLLSFTVKRGALPVLKLLNSGIAAASHDFHIDEKNLFVSKVFVDEGSRLKRWHPMSRGRAYSIEKRVSHITITLAEINPTAAKEDKKVEKAVKKAKIEKPEVQKKIVKKTRPAGARLAKAKGQAATKKK